MISFKRIKGAVRSEVIANKKLQIITLILLAFAGIIFGFNTEYDDISSLAVFLYAVSGIPLYILCISVFKDMHDIPSADVQMSMPLNSKERYLARILTLARIWLIPLLISFSGGAIVSNIMLILRYNSYIESMRRYEDVVQPSLSDWMKEMFFNNTRTLFYILAAALFIVAVTVLCQVCVGSKAESIYIPVCVMIILSLLPGVIYMLVRDKFADCGSYYDHLDFISFWTFSGMFYEPEIYKLVINCLISLVLIFSLIFIYDKRDARSVGTPVVFKLFLELLVFFMAMLFFTITHVDDINGIVMFLGWLTVIILRIIVSRKKLSVKKILIWTAYHIGCYVVFIVFLYASFLTGCFGALMQKPSDKAFDSDMSYYTIDVNIYDSSGYYSRYYDSNNRDVMDISEQCYNTQLNINALKDIADIASKSSVNQAKTDDLFGNIVFGIPAYTEKYYCRVSIRGYNEYSKDIYEVKYYLSKKDAYELAENMNRAMSRLIIMGKYDYN